MAGWEQLTTTDAESYAPSPSTGKVLKIASDGSLEWGDDTGGSITALTGNVENRIATFGNTTTELIGESGLTYNGSTLDVTGTISASSFLAIDGNALVGVGENYLKLNQANLSAGVLVYNGGLTVQHQTADAKIEIKPHADYDAKLLFNDGDANKWEIMRDESDGHLHIGRAPATSYPDIVINKDNGFIGLGIDPPTKRLHIQDDGNDPEVHVRNAGNQYVNMGAISYKMVGPSNGSVYTFNRTSADHLKFQVNSNTSLYMKSDGTVGIGTDSPSELLHLYGDENENRYLKIEVDSAHASGFKLKNVVSASDNEFSIYNRDTGNLRIYHGTGANINITPAGLFGIGTDSPSKPLHIYSGDSGLADASFHSYSQLVVEDDNHAGIEIITPNDKQGQLWFDDEDGSAIGGIVYDHGATKMKFYTEGSSRVAIDSTGKVGIGTDSPASKLDIQGNILTIGSDYSETTLTDATFKVGGLVVPHYTNSEEPHMLARLVADDGDSRIEIGGGTGAYNSVREIQFFTASDDTTTSGTRAMTIDTSQNATFTGHLNLPQGKDLKTSSIYSSSASEPIIMHMRADDGVQIKDSSGNVDVHFQSNGNVGIGEDEPSELLTVLGGNVLFGDAGDSGRLLYFTRNSVIHGQMGALSGVFDIRAQNNKNLNLFSDNGYGISVKEDNTVVFSNTGNITMNGGGGLGIGTASPATELHVQKSGIAYNIGSVTDLVTIYGGFTNNPSGNGGIGIAFHMEDENAVPDTCQTGRIASVSRAGSIETLNNAFGADMEFHTICGGTLTKYLTLSGNDNLKKTIFNQGRVGIGTTPATGLALHVYSDDSSTSNTGLRIEQDGEGDALLHFNLSGARNFCLGLDHTDDFFKLSESSDLHTTPRITIANTTGNVGIGTDTPSYNLDVVGTDATVYIDGSATGADSARLILDHEDVNDEYGEIIFKASGTEKARIWNTITDDGGLNFRTGTSGTDMTILSSGAVGIGTDTVPNAPFHIKGSSHTYLTLESSSAVTSAWMMWKQASSTRWYTGLESTSGTEFRFQEMANNKVVMKLLSGGGVRINGTPNAALTLEDTGSNPISLNFDNSGSTGNYQEITFNDSSGQEGYIRYTHGTDALVIAGAGGPSAMLSFDSDGDATFSGEVKSRSIQAKNSSGLGLYDDSGQRGIEVVDGGNVGIRTDTVDKTLHIAQSADDSGIRISGFDDMSGRDADIYLDSYGQLHISNPTQSGGNEHIYLSPGNSIFSTNTHRFTTGIDSSGTDVPLYIGGSYDANIVFRSVNNANIMTLDGGADHRVGFGANPSYGFHIKQQDQEFVYQPTANYGMKLSWSNGNASGIIDTFSDHDMEFRTNNTKAMVIENTGDIIIQNCLTADQDTYLDLKGNGSGKAEMRFYSPDANTPQGGYIRCDDANDNNLEIKAMGGGYLRLDATTAIDIGVYGSASYARIDDDMPLCFGIHQDYSIGYKQSDNTLRITTDGNLDDTGVAIAVKTDGKVGIGTHDPSQKLDIHDGAIRVIDTTNNSGMMLIAGDSDVTLQGNPQASVGDFIIESGTGTTDIILKAGASERMRIASDGLASFAGNVNLLQDKYIMEKVSATAGNRIKLKNSGTGNMEFNIEDSQSTWDFIFTNGNVGIGQDDPDELLHIKGGHFRMESSGAGVVTNIQSEGPWGSSGGGDGGLQFQVLDSTGNARIQHGMRRVSTAANGDTVGDYPYEWWASNADGGLNFRMKLNRTGLGIGTQNPTEKLHVAGNIKTTGNIVTSGNLALDASGTIDLDTDDGKVYLKDDGVVYGVLSQSSGANLRIQSGSGEATAIDFSGANVAVAGKLTVDASLSVEGTYAGGTTSTTTATGTNSFAHGNNCDATGTNGVAFGQSNLASGFSSFAANQSSTASGAYSAAFGIGCSTNGKDNAMVSGSNAKNFNHGELARGYGKFTYAGDAQTMEYVARISTTDGSATEMFLNGSSQRMVIPNNTTWLYNIQVVARDLGTGSSGTAGDSAGYQIKGVISNDSDTVTQVGVGSSLPTAIKEDDADWTIATSADDTNKSLKLEAKGKADTNIRWVAFIRIVAVSSGNP